MLKHASGQGHEVTRYAVAAIYGRRDSVPAGAAQDPTVLLYLTGGLRPAVPLFEEAAAQARARGELAREVHCRASAAPVGGGVGTRVQIVLIRRPCWLAWLSAFWVTGWPVAGGQECRSL